MSRAAQASFFFGLYVVVLGALLVAAPNVLLTTFAFPPTSEPWIRVLGLVAGVLGTYYVQAGRTENVAFFRMSVPGRVGVFVGFGVFVLLGWAGPQLVLFGGADLAGAVWTAWALRGSATAVATPR
jgi:hypothetical protein